MSKPEAREAQMSAVTYAERLGQQIVPVMDAAAQLDELAATLPTVPARSTVRNAAARLRSSAMIIKVLGDALFPYADPAFYRELPPSSAAQDQGAMAAAALGTIFSE